MGELKVIKCTREQLETWRTSRLGCYFMNVFSLDRGSPEGQSLLEVTATILSKRAFSERRGVYLEIERTLRLRVQSEDYEGAAGLRDMLSYYRRHVLD